MRTCSRRLLPPRRAAHVVRAVAADQLPQPPRPRHLLLRHPQQKHLPQNNQEQVSKDCKGRRDLRIETAFVVCGSLYCIPVISVWRCPSLYCSCLEVVLVDCAAALQLCEGMRHTPGLLRSPGAWCVAPAVAGFCRTTTCIVVGNPRENKCCTLEGCC